LHVRPLAAAVIVGLIAVALPVPAFALGVPETLAAERTLGDLEGRGPVTAVRFEVDYLGVSWAHGEEPTVRFLVGSKWGSWQTAHEDDMPKVNGRTFAALVAAPDGATAYQLRGSMRDAEAVAINTTDGPRPWSLEPVAANAAHLSQPSLVTREQWGADESYRFNTDGSEKWPPAFYPTQKLVIHHTATKNDDPDPAATVRAIYRYHAIDKGWGDIGYNFLVDASGNIYKGRYSGPAATWNSDTTTGENSDGHGVTAAHISGYNSGTMGIAVLGTYTTRTVSAAARTALIDHLAWEAEQHGTINPFIVLTPSTLNTNG